MDNIIDLDGDEESSEAIVGKIPDFSLQSDGARILSRGDLKHQISVGQRL